MPGPQEGLIIHSPVLGFSSLGQEGHTKLLSLLVRKRTTQIAFQQQTLLYLLCSRQRKLSGAALGRSQNERRMSESHKYHDFVKSGTKKCLEFSIKEFMNYVLLMQP